MRLLCCAEWCHLHGCPTDADDGAGIVVPVDFGTLIKEKVVNPVETMSMMGKGWHLPSAGAWIMWALGSVESVEDVTGGVPLRSSRLLSPSGDACEYDTGTPSSHAHHGTN